MTDSTETAAALNGDENDVDSLRAALFGRSVVSVKMYEDYSGPKVGRYGDRAEGEVRLDDGTILYLAGNVGGCSCGAGDYYLTRLNSLPLNGITDVQVKVDDSKVHPRWGEGEQTYSVFVLAMGAEPVELAAFKGDDGNGYYGTGFWFSVVRPENGSSPE